MKERLLNTIEILRKKGDYQYILSRYVDTGFWMDSVEKHFGDMFIENFTDFNYSTCFTMFLNISGRGVKVGTEEFTNFIKKNLHLHRIQIQISAIAPYATFKFVKYVFDNGEIRMIDSFVPFLEEHRSIEEKLITFLTSKGLTILYKELLSIEIQDMSLEMRASKVTAYHCLFEDEY